MEESNEELSVQKILKSLTEEEKEELFEGIKDGNNEKAKEIIAIMEDINEDIKNDLDYGGSALHVSCHFGRIELVKYLIELGVDINNIYKELFSPLMKTSRNGNIEVVKLLLNAGADLNYTNENGNSALSYTAMYKRLELFEFFLSSGIDLDKCGGNTLISATVNENIQIVKRLIELGVNVNYVDLFNRCTALHYACQWNNTEIVKLLMEHGADETIKDKKGKTPIEKTGNEEINEIISNYNSSKFVLK